MSDLAVLAVDPGSRYTGIVLRRGEELLAWHLTVRHDRARLPGGDYLARVLTNCLTVHSHYPDHVVVAVEGLADWPERGGAPRRNQHGLYGTAMVLGAVLVRWPAAVVVDSGRGVANYHPQSYPSPIRPPVNGKGKDKLNHVRAAWDHSFAGETLWLQRAREANR